MDATVTRNRTDFTACTIAEAITSPGKVLSIGDTVATARRLLANHPVQLLPVLDGTRYVGAVDRWSVAGVVDHAPVDSLTFVPVPTASASTPAIDALADLDRADARRLVVLDGDTYVGLVCMRRDRARLCVDAAASQPSK